MRLDSEKLSLHPVLVSNWLLNKVQGPVYVEISPTNKCNHKCIFCACRSVQGSDAISLKVMLRTISSMCYFNTRAIMFGGEGEPLLHPDIEEILAFTSELCVDFAITTNGSMLNSINPHVLLRAKWIKISIDAGCPETYAIVHGVKKAAWNQLFDNIAKLHQYKRIEKSKCVIGTQITVMQENHNDISSLARKLKEVGGDYLVVKPYSPSLISENCASDKNYSDKTIARTVRKANAFFPVIYRTAAFRAIQQRSNYDHCYAVPYFWAYIRSNGDVVGCSSHMTSPEFIYGNVNEHVFQDIWLGEKRDAATKYMRKFDISHCRKACRMNQCNEYLHNVVNPGEHYNFI